MLVMSQRAGEKQSVLSVSGSSAGAQTDYPVRYNATYAAGMASDFHDVHFQSAGIELSFWRESDVTSTSAVFWIKVPSIPASPGTVSVSMLYGNAARADSSSGVD